MSADRSERPCTACGQVDDHPRHTDGFGDQMRHLDCCAAAGCPDGSCDSILAKAGGARGAELISFLTGGTGSDG